MRTRFLYATAMVGGLMLPGPVRSQAEDASEWTRGLDEFVTRALQTYNTPGAAVSVVQGDRVIYAKGFGVRRAGSDAPVDENTLFMAASVTKTITVGTLAVLVDEGKLRWDDPIVDHLPGFQLYDPYPTRMATVRDMVAHRSGLPPFTGDLLEATGYSRPEILRRIRYVKPTYSFREKAGYSNLGYLVAGLTAARAGNGTWEEVTRERLLDPLGMTRSGLSSRDRQKTDNFADAHALQGGKVKVMPWDNHDPLGPAGSLTTTAADLGRWAIVNVNEGKIDGKQVLSAEQVAEMHRPAMVEVPTFAETPPIGENTGFSYGLGWGVFYINNYKVLEKGGARHGMRAVVVLVPEKKAAICVLANMNLTLLPEAVRAFFLERVCGKARGDIQAEIYDRYQKIQKTFDLSPPAPPREPKPHSLALEEYAGTYRNDLYGDLVITHKDGKLTWKAGPAEYGAELSHFNYDTFILHYPPGRIAIPEEVVFTIGSDGKPMQLHSETLGEMKRVEPAR